MLHQDQPVDPKLGGQGAEIGGSGPSSLQLLSNSQQQPNRKREKDSNFNFLGQEDEVTTGDDNRNQMRPRNPGHPGRDAPPELPPGGHYGPVSPLSRLPCWSPLEPLPEIESGDDCYGRVPPDGAEEDCMDEETGRTSDDDDDKERGPHGVRGRGGGGGRRAGLPLLAGEGGGRGAGDELDEEGLEEEELEENGVEWDSDSDFDFCYRSGSSLSSLNMESGGEGALVGGWGRVGVGETSSDLQEADGTRGASDALSRPPRKWEESSNRRGGSRTTLVGSTVRSSLLEEDRGSGGGYSDSDTDPCDETPELPDSVWTLRDRERFKAQEMEKHRVQLTMYRRLALIRWIRTLQSSVQEQQNRLQASFDVILDHRKELLRMGAAAAATATASQS